MPRCIFLRLNAEVNAMINWNRRNFVKAFGVGSALSCLPLTAWGAIDPLKTNGKRVVVLGGGFGGTIAAKTLRMTDPTIEVVLVDRESSHVACPTSNLVIGGSRTMEQNRIGYNKLVSNHGITFVQDNVTAIDSANKTVIGAKGKIAYDRLIVSPGIDFRFEEIQGYDPVTTPQVMPHAWKAGAQTLLLRKQLEEMKDGGVFVISIPAFPIRCPPGPYERICQVAWYFKQAKPKSRIIVLDANPDILSKGKLFRKAWMKYYDGMIDYRPSQSVVRVTPASRTVHTEVEDVRGDVVNVIPAQKAALIAHQAGLVGEDKRWCPVNQMTFESTLVPNIHVIGDACIAGTMPKSGFSANSHAKICALNMVAAMNGKKPTVPSAANVCYSFVTDKEAISVSAVYRLTGGSMEPVPNSGGLSPDLSEIEGLYGRAWIANILAEMST